MLGEHPRNAAVFDFEQQLNVEVAADWGTRLALGTASRKSLKVQTYTLGKG